MKPIITEITSYEAVDGLVFNTEAECLRHELWLRLKEKYGTYFVAEERSNYKDYSNNNFLFFSSLNAYDRFITLNSLDNRYVMEPIEMLIDLNLTKSKLILSKEEEYAGY